MTGSAESGDTAQRDAFVGFEGNAYFDRNPNPHGEPHNFDEAIGRFLPEAPSVLEVGCADGRRLARLNRLVPGSYSGVEPSMSAVEHGRSTWQEFDLRVGTADALPLDETFDAVILGFFLYVCDRALLPRIVAEVDRVVRDGGILAVIDFAAPYPSRRPYHHVAGLHTFRMRYENLFLAFPSYSLLHRSGSSMPTTTRSDGTDDIVLTILRKRLDWGYAVEDAN